MAKIHVLRLLAATIVASLISVGILAAPAPVAAARAGWQPACGQPHGRVAGCFASFRPVPATHPGVRPMAVGNGAPTLTPADIVSAYKLPASSARPTIAIVDAYDNPKAETDLGVYRARYHLPACTSANRCFRKVNQRGSARPLPAGNAGWGVEIALDLDAVSAACPSCHILLVEADSAALDDLGAAVNTAVRLGANVVSNSYGAPEFSSMSAFSAPFVHRGVPIVASSGDSGYGKANFPAALPTTIAVGGTSLSRAPSTNRRWTEHAWGGAGSGCSGIVAKPSWQHDQACRRRTVADVSAVADPNSGFMVYDTYGLGSDAGYLQVGGTSLSAPLIAAMIGRAGNASTLSDARRVYAHPGSLFDVQTGSSGSCGRSSVCTAGRGYDGPTGLGSPNGLGAL